MKRISDNRIELSEGEETRLGIRTGIEPRGYVAQQVAAVARRGAVLFEEGQLTRRPIERMIPLEGEYYLVVPWLEGETLEELLPAGGVNSPPPWLTAFLRASLRTMENADIHPGNIRTCLITENMGVLFYDSGLARELNRSISADLRARVHTPYTDERLQGAAERAYQAAAIIYHALCGTAPETRPGGTITIITPVHRHNPLVHRHIAEAIDHILSGEDRDAADRLRGIQDALEANGGRWFDEINSEEAENRRKAAGLREKTQRQVQSRRSFWRRNRTRLLVGALILLVAGSIPVTMLRSYLQPPLTKGLEPRELIEGYYRAWTELDHIFMEDAVARGVERDTIREVINIYVIDRVQAAHAMHGRLIAPEEWLAEGRPVERIPYGVSDLIVTILEEGADLVRAEARYSLWRPAGGDEGLETVFRAERVDRITVRPAGQGWEISKVLSRTVGQETIPLAAPDPQ